MFPCPKSELSEFHQTVLREIEALQNQGGHSSRIWNLLHVGYYAIKMPHLSLADLAKEAGLRKPSDNSSVTPTRWHPQQICLWRKRCLQGGVEELIGTRNYLSFKLRTMVRQHPHDSPYELHQKISVDHPNVSIHRIRREIVKFRKDNPYASDLTSRRLILKKRIMELRSNQNLSIEQIVSILRFIDTEFSALKRNGPRSAFVSIKRFLGRHQVSTSYKNILDGAPQANNFYTVQCLYQERGYRAIILSPLSHSTIKQPIATNNLFLQIREQTNPVPLLTEDNIGKFKQAINQKDILILRENNIEAISSTLDTIAKNPITLESKNTRKLFLTIENMNKTIKKQS